MATTVMKENFVFNHAYTYKALLVRLKSYFSNPLAAAQEPTEIADQTKDQLFSHYSKMNTMHSNSNVNQFLALQSVTYRMR